MLTTLILFYMLMISKFIFQEKLLKSTNFMSLKILTKEFVLTNYASICLK